MVQTISREDLLAKIDRGDAFTLVEALPADVYAHAHLPGAINLPFESEDEIAWMAANLLPEKVAEIVVYCGNTL